MKISLVSHTSSKTNRLSDFIYSLEIKFQQGLKDLNLEDDLIEFIVGVNLNEFESSDKLVTHFRNYKGEKSFEFTLNLNIDKYLNIDFNTFKVNFCEDLSLAVLEVFEKRIKNKTLGKQIVERLKNSLFGGNVELSARANLESPKTAQSNSIEERKIDYFELDESRFWNIIKESFGSEDNFTKGSTSLVKKLSTERNEVIIGFHLTLRRLINSLETKFIIERAKDVNSYLSDDLFIYMRCNIISLGLETYGQAIIEAESLSDKIFEYKDGEELLYAADNAIDLKHKGDYNSDLPSYISDKKYGPLL